MNDNNLIPQAHVLTVEEQSKGGKRSAEVRAQRQQLRNVVQDVINGTYTEDGEQLTGSELIGKRLAEVLSNTSHRNWFDVVQLVCKLTDSDKTEKELELIETRQQHQIDTVHREEEDEEWLDKLGIKHMIPLK